MCGWDGSKSVSGTALKAGKGRTKSMTKNLRAVIDSIGGLLWFELDLCLSPARVTGESRGCCFCRRFLVIFEA
jgi:hypothetical protein